MQGITEFIPTDAKAEYINLLLKAGFDTIDFGSFVSSKVIPQLKDTVQVLSKLSLTSDAAKLLAIVANVRGAENAMQFEEISYIGFPFSVSEIFQKRNTNSTLNESIHNVEVIHNLCEKNKKQLVVYISMAFGNPYDEPWDTGITGLWADTISSIGVKIISLADTVGVASAGNVGSIFQQLIPALPDVELGVHLHCKPGNWRQKVEAAFSNGCRRFDTAIMGFGGCPMASDNMVGNLPTENLLQYLSEKKIETRIEAGQFNKAMKYAQKIFI